MAIRKQSVIANPMETVGQNVKEEAAYEFTRLQRHDMALVAVAVLAAEADVAPVHTEQPIVGDRNAVRIARKIGQYPFGTGEGPLGIDDPCDRKSSGEENEHDVLKPFNAIQRV
jgi:hypothetical protein